MKSIAATTLFASVVLAQSASLIPSGISTQCSTFLTQFNQDTNLTSCTSAIISATSAFAPSTNASAAAATPSTSAISSALNSVCSSSATCSETVIRSKLADFYNACTDELSTNPNQDVIRTYDVLYALTPFKNAICSKDDSGRYCVNQIASNSTASSSGIIPSIAQFVSTPLAAVSSAVSRRATVQQVVAVAPNATTFAANNLLFLMLKPNLPSSSLCASCTRSVLTSYISYESETPYAPGLSSSVLLSGQSKLYQGVQSTCGANFLSGAVAAAAGLSGGVTGQITSGASSLMANTGVAGALMGAVVLVLSASL
ncbi:hypothetical protein BN946_scf184902.g12 [Trametes cinnabarina]|uniref:Uncharacterized protein n=1 Tax=Pycnoporus cinnabarinus TaxID=5643 RepID=A0A060SY58_PYCCI|nr:hypothetical protein BN946_scf184902.g12 [Trametes cinnabarina]